MRSREPLCGGSSEGGGDSRRVWAVPLREALRTLRRRWLILLLVTGAVLGAAGYFLAGQEEVYEAKATIAVLPDPDNPTLVPFY